MDLKELSIKTWAELDKTGNVSLGYKSRILSFENYFEPCLHLFIDEMNVFHFAIEASGFEKYEIEDPGINGLKIKLSKYLLGEERVSTYIDISCSLQGFIIEFTEVIREIARNILQKPDSIPEAINAVIRKWKAFWSSANKGVLSEEKQIGLICELIIFEKLCKINPHNALNWWTGPLAEKYDFIFSDWCFEIKGTRNNQQTHTINGIDQLKPPNGKKLAFISLIVSVSNNEHSVSLQSLIEYIISNSLQNKPDLIIKFDELLAKIGYSPIYATEYRKFKLDILGGFLYHVDLFFPSLISDKLKTSLDTRITNVRYDISLNGLNGIELNNINFGNYFY